MGRMSEVEVVNRELYSILGTKSNPVAHGVLDRRLGMSVKKAKCDTCDLELADCLGHFGHIRLSLPVFHVGYFKNVISILQMICKSCSRILLPLDARLPFFRKLRNPGLDPVQKEGIFRSINTVCRKMTECPYCSACNGSIRKIPPLKIVHEKYRQKSAEHAAIQFRKGFDSVMTALPEIKSFITKAQDDIHPLRCWQLFENIPDEDCELLGMILEEGRPENLLWKYILVPPACIRPSVEQEGGSNEDDLTVKLTDIVYTNLIIKDALDKGAPINSIMGDWEYLQLQCAMYINSALPGVPPTMQLSSRPIRGFVQRLNGKQGRFRGNLSGKRVDFSGRTVISPDPNLKIGEVGIPIDIAKMLTYPERVTGFNIEKLKQAVLRGNEEHPGALYIQQKDGFKKQLLRKPQREKIANELRIGDIVERHLDSGDVVLFNRQPSLHKLSIMAHIAKVKPWKTFRFNECTCAPYNADFDGDEMNIHFPQTEEARAEALELMSVRHNLVTPRNGQPVIAAIQDFLTCSYLLSHKDVYLDRSQFCKIVSYMFDACIHIDLPLPAIMKPKMLWTGKQIFNLMMKPNRKSSVLVNLQMKCRNFIKPAKDLPLEFCPIDGYLIVRNSYIISGSLDKSNMGDGSKTSIFYVIMRDFGSSEAVDAMTRLSKLSARWIGDRGFSIGINDVQPGETLQKKKEKLVSAGYDSCDKFIIEFENGVLKNLPGCNSTQSLESSISGALSKIREDVGSICIDELSPFNSPLIMQACGSKGSKINVSQMVACVGQQIVSGSRIPDGFADRSLPHFLPNSKTPAAKGFVKNSFYSGLEPTEFFFHAMGGREGLIDTAVKTAETGYMQRRLMKALEDLSVHYDLSVRNSIGGMIQFIFGADGLDPANMEGDDQPVNFIRNLIHSRSIITNCKDSIMPGDLVDIGHQIMKDKSYYFICSELFVKQVLEFLEKGIAQPLQSIFDSLELSKRSKTTTSYRRVFDELFKISKKQLDYFLQLCLDKYRNAIIEPGTAVGAIGAQSIGEPGTQMTLKTFHFAGVASMNVTLGVPRIKEIINASKNISTPIITARLVNDKDLVSARIIKGRLEETNLGDIAQYIEELITEQSVCLVIKLDLDAIQTLQLEINIESVYRSILKTSKLKLKDSDLMIEYPDKITVSLSERSNENLYFTLQRIKRLLPLVLLHGISSVTRAIINDNNDGSYVLYVEGNGLRQVMATPGVDGRHTVSNHIMEVQKVLGIEAARFTITEQIQDTMAKHGMTIDYRHVILLADLMTYKGEILGITRFGISKMKDSVLMLASFEQTAEHLFTGAFYGKQDQINGVSECIILGVPMPIGTGIFKVLQNVESTLLQTKSLLFDIPEYHPHL